MIVVSAAVVGAIVEGHGINIGAEGDGLSAVVAQPRQNARFKTAVDGLHPQFLAHGADKGRGFLFAEAVLGHIVEGFYPAFRLFHSAAQRNRSVHVLPAFHGTIN